MEVDGFDRCSYLLGLRLREIICEVEALLHIRLMITRVPYCLFQCGYSLLLCGNLVIAEGYGDMYVILIHL